MHREFGDAKFGISLTSLPGSDLKGFVCLMNFAERKTGEAALITAREEIGGRDDIALETILQILCIIYLEAFVPDEGDNSR